MEYYWHGPRLKDFLTEIKDIKRIRIATAYLSWEGLSVIKNIVERNNLSPNQLTIYLSSEFSYDKPGKLLEELCKIGKIFLVERIGFHAKVYLFQTQKSKNIMLFGSSNLTNGGIQGNIEFDLIKEADEIDYNKAEMFFDFCARYAFSVTKEVIAEYESYEIELRELRETERKIKRKLYSRIHQTDPFDETKYDLDKFYFQFSDYEIFFPRNHTQSDAFIMTRRRELQKKLLNIHERINEHIITLGLHCHWNLNHITTQIVPSIFNKGKVNWLGVRYGKTEAEVKLLNYNATKDEMLGFQKHACIQFSLGEEEFAVGLFHAVSHDAIDRSYLHERLENAAFKQKLIKEIEKLKGYEFIWYIHNNGEFEEFDLDNESASNFVEFYQNHDRDGVESYLSYHISPDDDQIRTIDSIVRLILERVKLLLPIYELLVYRPKIK